jgi:hypothetical protein
MTPKQLEILQHSLGVDEYGQGEQYRNHFCAGEDDADTCRELIAVGYMAQHETTPWLPYFNCFVTAKGVAAMRAASPAPPKLTRSQKRYRQFLKADTGESFSEWLKDN